MPTEQDLLDAEEQRQQLLEELKLIQNGDMPEQAAKSVIDFMISTEEPLTSDNNPYRQSGGCCVVM